MSNIFQRLADEVIDFFELIVEWTGDATIKSELARDLGLDPAVAATAPPLPTTAIEAVQTYRATVNPTLEQNIAVLGDIAIALNAVIGIAESFGHSPGDGLEEVGHDLLELAASNYVRLRLPRLFLLLQLVSLLDEVASTYGEGSNNVVRFKSFATLATFLFQPGKTLAQLDPTNDHPGDNLALITDFGFRIIGGILGGYSAIAESHRISDALNGWDGPGVDAGAAQTPSIADIISGRMTTVSLGFGKPGTANQPSSVEHITITTAMVPADEGGGGTSFFLAVGGNVSVEQPINERWKMSLRMRADAGIAALLGHQNRIVANGVDDLIGGSFTLASQPDQSSNLSFAVPSDRGTRLEIGALSLALSLVPNGAEILVSLANSALVIEAEDADSFLSSLLGKSPVRLPFSLTLGYSSSRGLVLEGSLPAAGTDAQPNAPLSGAGNVGPPIIAATIPVGRSFGGFTVHEVSLRVARGPADAAPKDMNRLAIEVDSSFSAQLGPVYVRVDQFGLQATFDSSKPRAERNLGVVDLGLGLKFPRGVAVEVNTAAVSGGGSILHDPDLGLYFGTLALTFRGGLALKAIGLVTTKDPDGSKNFSMLLIVTAEFERGYPIGPGFRLLGVGGMLAVHRTFDEAALRAALPTGQLRNVLFPTDPVHHSTETLAALQTFFPARHGSYLFGVLAKAGWGLPVLVHFELGLILELGNRTRIILLGQVSAILPKLEAPLITINMDSVGVLDFDAGTFALDAVLHHSRLLDRFVLSGAMAMRMTWHGSFGLALAVGGLHPQFVPPAGFPVVDRLQLALSDGDNPKLVCQSYFAITSNTVQFGADCSLYAAAYGFSITGDVGYDVLIQVVPFHFVAEFHASVQLKRGSHNLFKVSVAGELEGPLPLRLAGRATFEILWCDFSVSFNKTLVDGDSAQADLIDVLAVLKTVLGDPVSWQPQLPPATSQLVTVRTVAGDGILLHPQGTLTVRQSLVPLGLTRDLDRVGSNVPSGERRFAITAAAIGPVAQNVTSVQEMFAPGQFFEMSDDDRLAAPSFESMDAGVSFGDGGYAADLGARVVSTFSYTNIVVGEDGVPVLQPDPHVQEGGSVLVMTQRSAAALARTRQGLTDRFAAPAVFVAPSVTTTAWAAVNVRTGQPASTGPSWAEARAQVTNAARWSLVPRFELGEAP